MCAVLDPEIRQWLDIGAEYLTAVGTVGAVIVALYLASKDRREKISYPRQFIISFRRGVPSLSPYGSTG